MLQNTPYNHSTKQNTFNKKQKISISETQQNKTQKGESFFLKSLYLLQTHTHLFFLSVIDLNLGLHSFQS